MNVEIKEVLTPGEYLSFVKFAEQLYKDEPNWVCPLRFDELNILKKEKNPSYEYCDARLFIAFKEGKPAGRVAAIINHKSNSIWGEKRMRFGWFDFIDDYTVSEALINRVEEWAHEMGMDKISGPQGFNDLDKQGLLVEGFENMATVTTLYNYAYYEAHYTRLGLEKEVDWTQRVMDNPDSVPEKLSAFSDIIMERYNLRLLPKVSKKELYRYGRALFDSYNRSFVPLFCFSPITEKEREGVLKQFIPMVRQELLALVLDKDDNIAAFAITVPSIAKALNRAKGKLLPFGLFHITRALKRFDTIEMYMIGVAPEYQKKGLNAIIFNRLNTQFLKYGVRRVITNPQLESNTAVTRLFDYYPMAPYMRRRCLVKKIGKGN